MLNLLLVLFVWWERREWPLVLCREISSTVCLERKKKKSQIRTRHCEGICASSWLYGGVLLCRSFFRTLFVRRQVHRRISSKTSRVVAHPIRLAMPDASELVAAADTLAQASLYNEAISTYTKAIELTPSPTYYVKRY